MAKDREELPAFYDLPAERWVHIRTTNPVESTLAIVRLRTRKTRGCLSRVTAMTMVFKLARERAVRPPLALFIATRQHLAIAPPAIQMCN